MNKNFCIIPFIGLDIDPGGQNKPCCKYSEWNFEKKATEHSLSEVYNSAFYNNIRKQFLEGKFPKECSRCHKDEEKGLVSMRVSRNKEFGHLFEEGKSENYLPQFISFGFGNLCNAACISCNSSLSSYWIKEDEHLSSLSNNKFKRHVHSFYKDSYNWPIAEIENFKVIGFSQTEAMLSPEFNKFIQKAAPFGQGKRLEVITNASYFVDESTINNMLKFSEVEVTFSVDGIGKRNEYLRYPLKWNLVEKNIEKWCQIAEKNKNLKLILRTTLNALNALYLQEVIDWWEQLKETFPKAKFLSFQVGHVDFPDYLSTQVLPVSIKNQAMKNCSHPVLHKHMRNEEYDGHRLSLCMDYIDALNLRRGTSAQRVFPEFFELLS